MKRSVPEVPQEVPQRNYTAERDAEVFPAVREILGLLAARTDLAMGTTSTTSESSLAEYYQKVYQEDVVGVLLKYNLKLDDIPFVFSIMMQPIQLLSDITTASFEMNRDLADGFKYGIPDIRDLRIQDLDAALRAGAKDAKDRLHSSAKKQTVDKPKSASKKKRK